jgi:FkbM family methyltransferase
VFFDKIEYQAKFQKLKEIMGPYTYPGGSIVEIGAHYGEDSVRLAETFPTCQIHAFEPDPRNWKAITEHLPADRKKNITFYNMAVGAKVETAPFFLSHEPGEVPQHVLDKYSWIPEKTYREGKLNRSGASSLKKSNEPLEGAVMVPVTTLDHWLEKQTHMGLPATPIHLIWIDVQGGEREVILGAKTTLQATSHIWMEYGETDIYEGAMGFEETKELLGDYKFRICHYTGERHKGDILAIKTSWV